MSKSGGKFPVFNSKCGFHWFMVLLTLEPPEISSLGDAAKELCSVEGVLVHIERIPKS